jgi:hypothetical protein
MSLTPELGYRLPHGLGIRLRAPIHWKTFVESTPMIHREANGFGDLELVGSYDVSQAGWRFSVSGGAALPTGAHEAQPFVGDPVAPTPLQLGTGTLDPIVAANTDYHLSPTWGLDARAAARLAVMENMHDYRPASLFEVGVGAAWLPARGLGAALHADWSHVTKVAVAGVEAPNTGRDTGYLEPSLLAGLGGGLSVQASARIPIYTRVNATQFTEDVLFALRLVYVSPPLFGPPARALDGRLSARGGRTSRP